MMNTNEVISFSCVENVCILFFFYYFFHLEFVCLLLVVTTSLIIVSIFPFLSDFSLNLEKGANDCRKFHSIFCCVRLMFCLGDGRCCLANREMFLTKSVSSVFEIIFFLKPKWWPFKVAQRSCRVLCLLFIITIFK